MLLRLLVCLMILPSLALAVEPLDKVVAIVNDNVITASELNTQVHIFRQQLESKNMEVPAEIVLQKQVLQRLIDVDLQLQMAKSNNLTIEDSDLNQALEKIATDNHLSLTQLREAVTREGLGWEAFRENIRKEMLIHQLQQKSVSHEVVVSAQQVDNYLKTSQQQNKQAQQTYHVQNLIIPLGQEPSNQQFKAAQEKAVTLLKKLRQGADFDNLAVAESTSEFVLETGDLGERHLHELPAVFAARVVHMKAGEISQPIRTGNGFQLIKLVKIGGDDDSHHQVVKTHARHILLKQTPHLTTADAQKQINNLYQQLKSGKDFARMAKLYSLDALSAIKGGDLGWVSSEELVPQFAEAMNNLPLHVISKPIKSPFGWHIIEVLERKTVDDSDAYQRQQARQVLQQRKFTDAVQNWQQHLRTESYIKILDKRLA